MLRERPFYPCNSKAALEAFEELSAPHVASGTRTWVGKWAKRWGLFKDDEFKEAEARLQKWPQAEWQHATFTYGGEMGAVVFHHKNIVVEVASILRNAALDPKVMCVWGPERARDEETAAFAQEEQEKCTGDGYDQGYLSDICHGFW